MLMIYMKAPGAKRFRPMNYKDGVPVTNRIYATLWEDEHREHVQGLVDFMTKENPDYIFEIRSSG